MSNKKIEYKKIEDELPVRHLTSNEKLCTQSPLTFIEVAKVMPTFDSFSSYIDYTVEMDNEIINFGL